ncbi:MAG: glycoside hydrolase, partial [Acidobacteriales bacterium]|nr:glycoside hydrolase [Terriglobales bacterium]
MSRRVYRILKLAQRVSLCGLALTIGLMLLTGGGAKAQKSAGTLRRNFESPPQSALPLVWWHWMGGNITRQGIKLDLDWMHRVGIGGFQAFEGVMRTPTVVDHPMAYMSQDWKGAFKYAVGIGKRYGMEMAVASSPGWSETGGPWVRPADGMKKLVWSETRLHGGARFHGTLPRPPATVGPFQNVPVTLSPNKTFSPQIPEYYADSEVIAYKAPSDEASSDALHAKITVSSGHINAPLLTDHDLVNTVSLAAAPSGQRSWIGFEFRQPQVIRAVSLAMAPPKTYADADTSPTPILEASDDGLQFHGICEVKFLQHGFSPRGNVTQTTVSFAPVKARFYRVTWKMPDIAVSPIPQKEYHIAELALWSGARVNHFEEKAGFSTALDLTNQPTPKAFAGIAKNDVVILTGKLRSDGSLDWTAPSGSDWVILRFGYSLTGAKNSPAPAEATGIEVDKLDHRAVRRYLEHYLAFFKNEIGAGGLKYIVNDSWEAGNQNWTG